MGYTTHVTGEFVINPPLTWTEFKDSKFAPDNLQSHYIPSLALRVDETSVDTAEGPLLRRTATALVMREIDEYRERGLVAEVQEAVDSFPGHTFTGRLECEGEENTDLWRVVVRNGRAVKVTPHIVWPGDEPAESMPPRNLSRQELLGLLDDIRARVASGDSLEGSLEYLVADPDTAEHPFNVTAAFRVGNLDGQGGMVLVRGDDRG